MSNQPAGGRHSTTSDANNLIANDNEGNELWTYYTFMDWILMAMNCSGLEENDLDRTGVDGAVMDGQNFELLLRGAVETPLLPELTAAKTGCWNAKCKLFPVMRNTFFHSILIFK